MHLLCGLVGFLRPVLLVFDTFSERIAHSAQNCGCSVSDGQSHWATLGKCRANKMTTLKQIFMKVKGFLIGLGVGFLYDQFNTQIPQPITKK